MGSSGSSSPATSCSGFAAPCGRAASLSSSSPSTTDFHAQPVSVLGGRLFAVASVRATVVEAYGYTLEVFTMLALRTMLYITDVLAKFISVPSGRLFAADSARATG